MPLMANQGHPSILRGIVTDPLIVNLKCDPGSPAVRCRLLFKSLWRASVPASTGEIADLLAGTLARQQDLTDAF